MSPLQATGQEGWGDRYLKRSVCVYLCEGIEDQWCMLIKKKRLILWRTGRHTKAENPTKTGHSLRNGFALFPNTSSCLGFLNRQTFVFLILFLLRLSIITFPFEVCIPLPKKGISLAEQCPKKGPPLYFFPGFFPLLCHYKLLAQFLLHSCLL